MSFLAKVSKPLPYLNMLANTLEIGTGLYSDYERNDGTLLKTTEAVCSLAGNIALTGIVIGVAGTTAPALIAGAAVGYLGQYLGAYIGRQAGPSVPSFW